jgi:hypothetical protein
VRTDAAAAHNNDEGLAQLVEALGCQEDAIPRKLLKDQLIVEITGLRSQCESLVPGVLLVLGCGR